jgi:hypothetical protein
MKGFEGFLNSLMTSLQAQDQPLPDAVSRQNDPSFI